MIGWKTQREVKEDVVLPKGFDDFELRLGDVMRGERATVGKSLLDVQRELRIKASYIAAIENCDPSAFETPGFIAGYVRSYARYLNLDPDETFAAFCAESGFTTSHGMSDRASTIKKADGSVRAAVTQARDPFANPAMPFAPTSGGMFSAIEPGAIGSSLVLVALICGIGYGGWSVLQEVQRVQVTPVEQTPVVLSDLDPVAAALRNVPSADGSETVALAGNGVFTPPSVDAMDRLYRPQALDVPVLVARDAPISTLDPRSVGTFATLAETPSLPEVDNSVPEAASLMLAKADGSGADILNSETVTLVAARPAWVRVRGSDNAVIFEKVMNAGDTWTVPADQTNAKLNVGESGAIYFAILGRTFGPVGPDGAVTSDLPLIPEILAAAYKPAKIDSDDDLQQVIADLRQSDPGTTMPKVLQDSEPGVMMIAVRPSWVRVRAANGTVIFEGIMNAGDTWKAPVTENAPTLRTGESGAIYFALNGRAYGPAGSRGKVTSKLALSTENLSQSYEVADIGRDADLERVLAQLESVVPGNLPGTE